MKEIILTLKHGKVLVGDIIVDVATLQPLAIVAKAMQYIMTPGDNEYMEYEITLNYHGCAGFDRFEVVVAHNLIMSIVREFIQ